MEGSQADHRPVMTRQVLSYLLPPQGRDYIDATVGLGGHAEATMRASRPHSRLLGLDADPSAIARATSRLRGFGDRVTLKVANLSSMSDAARAAGFSEVSGVLMDLGFSSTQIDDPTRGFSFRSEGPLDMRYDQQSGLPARDVIARLSEKQLANVIYEFGGERRSRRIARHIVSRRGKAPFETT
ncbi:MAG: 16S rRNA (cytosine(1402)-N(4))-methyltransferase, partial [Chloroflexi bacterium]|nr:16S rRNA (cytosine(1402)-N(4))-methyltransferase [Chloroflexota bacterium]